MKKPILVLLSVLVLGTMATVVSAKPATTSPATAAAIKLYKSGNYTQSYVTFSEIVKKDPSNALAYYYLGMSSVQLGKKDEAIDNYSKAVELSPNGILGSYAKKGIKCAEDPLTCHDIPATVKTEETEEDKFIRSKFGSGLSNYARGVHEKQKIENIKREMNRNDDLPPQRFKEYKDFSSQGPTNDEIVSALRTLQAAGLTNVLNNQDYSDISYMMGTQTNPNNYEMLNALLGGNRGNNANLNPQIIQSLLTTQMTAGF